jgi:hypothetical protein
LRCCLPATRWRTSSTVNVFKGKTTTSRVLSWDTVMAGAVFPQAYLQMPEAEVGSHGGEHVMMPAGVFADFILVQAQFGFRLFEALFDGPTQATQPHKQG